jgi:hypothetical protein
MSLQPNRIKSLRALGNTVIVEDMNFSERQLTSGLILLSDNGKNSGIRPRWGRVYAIGDNQQDVKIGQWICVAHGRWTRGLDIEDENGTNRTIRKIDPNDILLVSNEQPDDDTMSTAVDAQARTR